MTLSIPYRGRVSRVHTWLVGLSPRRPFRVEKWLSLTSTRNFTSANGTTARLSARVRATTTDFSCDQARFFISHSSLAATVRRYVGVEKTLLFRRQHRQCRTRALLRMGRMIYRLAFSTFVVGEVSSDFI